MHKHIEKPACYLESGEPEPFSTVFRDGGKWCYMTLKDAMEHTPGCLGCKRVPHGWEQLDNA